MSKEQVKAILDRVLTWPEQRQEDAAKVLMLMEASDQSAYRLTDEQVAEVERRLADPNPRRLTLDAPCLKARSAGGTLRGDVARVTSKATVPSSNNKAYEVRRFARLKRANNQLTSRRRDDSRTECGGHRRAPPLPKRLPHSRLRQH